MLTVTWNRLVSVDTNDNYIEEDIPKFNLDLTIKDPNGQIIFSENDTLNNLIKVDFPLSKNGTYEIIIKNTTTKSRGHALAFERLSPIPGDFYPEDYIVNYNDVAILTEQWLSEEEDLEADLNKDGIVNLFDFAEFASHWLQTDSRYYQSR